MLSFIGFYKRSAPTTALNSVKSECFIRPSVRVNLSSKVADVGLGRLAAVRVVKFAGT